MSSVRHSGFLLLPPALLASSLAHFFLRLLRLLVLHILLMYCIVSILLPPPFILFPSLISFHRHLLHLRRLLISLSS